MAQYYKPKNKVEQPTVVKEEEPAPIVVEEQPSVVMPKDKPVAKPSLSLKDRILERLNSILDRELFED